MCFKKLFKIYKIWRIVNDIWQFIPFLYSIKEQEPNDLTSIVLLFETGQLFFLAKSHMCDT